MPDVTTSFTDAQWTRIVAASSYIKPINESGDVDAAYLAERFKKYTEKLVIAAEESKLSTDEF